MASILPITLSGDNLRKRHKQINGLVNKAFDAGIKDFKNILSVPEKSAIDRLFKIDLASKHRDVDYIIKNLKDNDMLYVSRALKSKWLLEPEHKSIVSPVYLEDKVYPYMITTAVNKMKHWIHLNLKDEQRSEEFYTYYSNKDFELAMKFLVKGSEEFILAKYPKLVHKVTPKYFKVLCEKNPKVAKIFFDLISTDEAVKSSYMKNEKDYFDSIKCLMKSDTNVYLDIVEKYFHNYKFSRLSPDATKYIMTHHKDRFLKKRELYAAWILNMETLAKTLTAKEATDLVEMLARAEYLKEWFSYKNVEPLIKRLKPKDRAVFKKKVFVNKDIEPKVVEWPYEPPSIPVTEDLVQSDIFEDSQHDPYEYDFCQDISLRKFTKYSRYMCEGTGICLQACRSGKIKTVLDKLYDEFRFVGFEKTSFELQKRILAESSSQNRQFIMLVLISKTGGRADAIASLMELLSRHDNEPANLRAAVIRSLVKRACIWRLPEETWKKLLQFGQGLGLDGGPPETDCVEGLHSVVIRNLIQNGTCDASIFNAFLEQFSDLSTYSLTSEEKTCISEALPKMLLFAAKEKVQVKDAVPLIEKLMIILRTYKLNVETYLDCIPFLISLAERDYSACSNLLVNMFNAKIGRKTLFRFTYKLIKTDASHINALKHDTNVLDFDNFYESCINNKTKFHNFFLKIAIYFNENDGLAMQYRKKLREKDHNILIGRSLVILLGRELGTYLQELDKEESVESKVFAATVRANAHRARPSLDIDTFGWRKAGAKIIANKLITCPSVDIKNNIEKLLEWKRTARLAFVLSNRTQNVTDVLVSVAKIRPTIGIKLGLKFIRKQGDSFDIKVWQTIKPLIQNIDFNKKLKEFYVQDIFSAADFMPIKIGPDYNILIFNALEKAESCDSYATMPYLCRIEHLLPNVSENFIETILTKFLEKDSLPKKNDDKHAYTTCNCMYLRIIFKYIYLAKSKDIQKSRFERFGSKVLDRMTEILETKEIFETYLKEIMFNFKNTKVFMDPKYVSCLPVMEKTVNWMQKILPIEEDFDKYATIHLTMLYYKAIRQTAKQAPEVFENETKRYKEAVKIVGNLFGKYIAKEVKELMEKYFESVIYLYKDVIGSYLDDYFNYIQSSDFTSSIIKGIIEEGKEEVRLAMYLMKDKYYNMDEKVSMEINSSFAEVTDLKNKFFAFAEVYA